MSDFTLWLVGMGTSTAVVIAATVAFVWYSHLRRKLPLAVKYDGLSQKVFELETRCGDLAAELKELLQRKQDAELDLQRISAEAGDAREWLNEHRQELLELPEKRREIEKVKNELAALHDETLRTRAERLQEEEKKAEAVRETDRLQREIAELRRDRDLITNRINSLAREEQTLQGTVKTLQSQQAELAARLPSLRAEVDRCEKLLASLREDLRRVEDEKREAEKARDRLRSDGVDLRKDIEELARRMADLRAREKELQSGLHGLEARHAKLSVDVPPLQNEYDRLHKGLETLRKELDWAEADRREAEKMRDTALSAAETLEKQIKQKEKLIADTQKMLDGITERMDAFKPIAALEDKLKDLMLPRLTLEAVGEEARELTDGASERSCFTNMQEYIRKSGFTYHERALLAFHTSLKTADISPLVVLAGVSGTGKSQLPRLYAEAMGMHFLNVAVQPRWDSPQDMFGFFNYMENRYKATELGRALRQMDYRNWPEDTGEQRKIQEGMLLVLLDEMNLARIEYYFSELLSRLEMRNAVRATTNEAVQLASMPLQLGSLQEGENPRYLYVRSNVLFVGTMNEDETTQALSPKVMDRANVLRFGRPEKTRGSRNDERQTTVEPQGYLVYEDWSGWNRPDLPQADKQRLEDVCVRLNYALELVHRPFGHRVHQAMESYLANYPTWVDAPFNHALADQLEQKIIPKLRGISQDTDDHAGDVYEAIKSVINELEDGRLLTAFSDASEAPVFEWHGVNRCERAE